MATGISRRAVAGEPSKGAGLVSVYIGKGVQRAGVEPLALDFDRQPHNLHVEALDLLLTKYGRPTVSELSAKDDVKS